MVERKPQTIGELKEAGYRVLSVKEEMRKNLIAKMERGEELFPGIVGYERTVIPQIENAILAGQDMVLLGERGQAKSRLIRNLVNLLDEEVPAVEGCEINDNPYDPICKACRLKVQELGDNTPIVWLTRDRRFGEKLATPDITIADLIGEVDPIKVAEGRYLADELTIHYGLIPRTNRGIFAINELPDLAERIQVGLFNLLEERDVQIKGYRIRLPLDIYVVATANPEDYTNRGRIITPLKDRYGAQIRTHYPRSIEQEIRIMDQEASPLLKSEEVLVPRFMKEIIAEFTALARRSPEINQRSGVSVRVSISNYETVISNALRRKIRLRESLAVPRITDLPFIKASTLGKIELETFEEGREERLVDDLLKRAIINTFARYFSPQSLQSVVEQFEAGMVVETGVMLKAGHYVEAMNQIPGMREAVEQLGLLPLPEAVASGVEFVLEGLHLNRRLNRNRVEGGFRYRA